MPKGVSLPKWPYGPDDPRWPKCKCGCDLPVAAWYRGDAKRGILNGQPRDYAPKHHGRYSADGVRYDGEGRKWCPACNRFRNLNEFTRGQRKSRCRDCVRDVNARTVYVPIAQDPENAARRRLQGKMRAHVRRAREKGLPYEKVDAVVLWKRDGGRCGICGEPVALEAMWPDHIVPTSRNGPTLYSNMRTACEPCNRRKYNYLDEELGIVDLSGASQANHPRSL